ncbi:pyridine nucleotide-disulfide oxidoreductase domain-containing protein 1 isoform X2 [Cylas formicarius]|uniref:pyridine nucleotide-disulfide oxidoreductase domain-containing protein 1 isoform X2 n=1 Tax=Cylas formicarius TaxID=197179 RepID=UPI002958977A|nr:pyridine nucleotide-disulfide oxidoreductase domain-containing protein 1 isoform X2 [Cylas formicarius]XP_060534413.1 pyridine nucleotide-disulfide oxidoreductase domain-containing protein 1 isoform X2 [Cylas formicarius]XP_060534414.1 pyridine nucleotide-disulfide oxidoreductase domain-containing protein 1 isoform X2 [Cylas formicarius]XP_060534415.1 pyridine nucleotide-disulfide oxidoreductase domain-containing protein 1 isoform X2 [Cylas formicarius]XP_060534416.1 pyridine nucleotide-disu
MDAVYVVVGGGIAGISCVETLVFFDSQGRIILISESGLIKTVTNLQAITKNILNFDVEEKPGSFLSERFQNVSIVYDSLYEINDEECFVKTKSGKIIHYQYLCLCMGAEPKLIHQWDKFPKQIIGIRDTDSVEYLIHKLKESKKIMIVGNGGIASELVYKIRNTEIHWVIKEKHISATFVDPGASEFFQDSLKENEKGDTTVTVTKRMRYEEDHCQKSGAALGPDWYKGLIIQGADKDAKPQLTIHYGSEISSVNTSPHSERSLEVTLNNGNKVTCDLIVSATGVRARTNFISKSELKRDEDYGILVNENMETNLSNIYAAGDICHANWSPAKHWFQMKLWTQARQMGCYAAKCMYGKHMDEEVLQDFCFEIFTHSTKLFGYKVILLGLFNGQKLGTDYEILLRTTKATEYVKFVLENHKLQGAVLIGDTDLEETCENLILNQIDLEPYGDDILNPNIDIEDYFD